MKVFFTYLLILGALFTSHAQFRGSDLKIYPTDTAISPKIDTSSFFIPSNRYPLIVAPSGYDTIKFESSLSIDAALVANEKGVVSVIPIKDLQSFTTYLRERFDSCSKCSTSRKILTIKHYIRYNDIMKYNLSINYELLMIKIKGEWKPFTYYEYDRWNL